MRKKTERMFNKKQRIKRKTPLSLRKQLSRIITFCCVVAVCIQALVMVTMIINQYVKEERENTLYVLKNDNLKIDNAIQYLEEMALSIQHDVGLKSFFRGAAYSEEIVTKQLKSAANLFSERNRLEVFEPLVEKVYLFNESDKYIYNLYYPMTMSEIEKSGEVYASLYRVFQEEKTDFYFQTEGEYLNLCMRLYDTKMEPLGVCIFALNKTGIEENFSNLEKMNYYSWSIKQGDKVLLGKETISPGKHSYVLSDVMQTGFGLSLNVVVSEWVIYQSLGATVTTILIISAALIFLVAFLGHMLAIYYVRPLETVAQKIKLVGEGNFDTKLDEYRIEELQNISNTFNEMTDYIERLVKEVYEKQLIAQQSQMQYLQAQMNPHFLFNVLSMIEIRAAFNQDKEVQEMLYKLSRLYQGKIFRKNEYFICFEEEMEIVEFYLSLQNSRFGEKIEYSICYDGDKAQYQKLMVPRLSIEPIVENAVCHGLEPKDNKGHIMLKVSRSEDKLKILIEDNGVGFDLKQLVENSEDKNHSHVGLWNTNKLIRNLCGKEYGLEIESKIGEGTSVCILLPVRNGENYVEGNDC